MCFYTDVQLWLRVRSETWKETTQSEYVLIGERHADFRATRAQSSLQSACATRGGLFSLSPRRQWRIHLLHIFKTRYQILQHASQIGSPFPLPLFQVSLFCFVLSFFFQTLDPVARFLSEVKKFFSSPKFLPSSLLRLARWISPGQSREEERLFDKTSEGPGARPVFPPLRFLPVTGCWKGSESNAN